VIVRPLASEVREAGRNDRPRFIRAHARIGRNGSHVASVERVTNGWQYGGDRGLNQNQLFDVEFRDLPFGIRIYTTSLCRIFASLGLSGADVYGNLVFGDQWYGTINLEKMPAKVIVKDRGSAGTNDPLDQLASVGWKAAHAAVILNQALGVRLETVSSSKNAA